MNEVKNLDQLNLKNTQNKSDKSTINTIQWSQAYLVKQQNSNLFFLTPFSSGFGKSTVRNSGSGSDWDNTGIKGLCPETSKALFTHCDPTPCIARYKN